MIFCLLFPSQFHPLKNIEISFAFETFCNFLSPYYVCVYIYIYILLRFAKETVDGAENTYYAEIANKMVQVF